MLKLRLAQHAGGQFWQRLLDLADDALRGDPDEAVAGEAGLARPPHHVAALLPRRVEQRDARVGHRQRRQVLPRRHLHLHLDREPGRESERMKRAGCRISKA